MTVHESSLSPSIHAVLVAELGMEEKKQWKCINEQRALT